MSNLFNNDLRTRGKSSLQAKLVKFWWLRAAFFLLVCFAVLFPFTKTGKDAFRSKPKVKEVAKPAPKAELEPEPIPEPVPKRIPTIAIGKDSDVRKTLKGFELKYQANFEEGLRASQERIKDDSYVANFSFDVKIPTPAKTAEELAEINPHLIQMLPGLKDLTDYAKVSPYYHKLYANKQARLKKDMLRLDKVLTSHNFFDCETMLEMKHPETGREVFLFQADMDVVTDGSDGDRLAVMPDEVVHSTYYQPTTSYSWAKVTDKPNPMIKGFENRIQNADDEIAKSSTSKDRRSWLHRRKKELEGTIEEMKRRSYLVAEHDPFIVISIDKIYGSRDEEHIPGVGDYVAVVYKDKIYPAICGDGGPTFKAGESSLRLAKELNPIATSYHRPVSTLGVTYIVFPGSAPSPKRAPDYDVWYDQTSKLLDEIGGLGEGYTLHRWGNTFPVEEVEVLEEASEVDLSAPVIESSVEGDSGE